MHVNSLITHLQLKKMLVMYESAQIVAITFKLLEMSSITTSNQTISNIRTRYIFSKSFFFRKNIGDFTDLHNEKNQTGSFVQTEKFWLRELM